MTCPQAVASSLLLYTDDTCLVFQYEIVIETVKQLIRGFSSLRDWFVDRKLSIHFREDNTKAILFSTKHKPGNAKSLNIINLTILKLNNIQSKISRM